MLVLTRKVGEAIHVGPYRVMLVKVDDGRARIGVEAPSDVPVHREEVVWRKTWDVVDIRPDCVVLGRGNVLRRFPTLAAARDYIDAQEQRDGA